MFQKFILCFILGICYIVFYPMKINKKKICFISYRCEKVEGDFKLISNGLRKSGEYELKYILIKYENNFMGKFKYLINCAIQVYHVNTSRIVILDYNNFVVSSFKKKSVKVLQIWHASGAIKLFGNDRPHRSYKIKNYNYVICTSDAWKDIYSNAFNVKRECVIPLGLPSSDCLFSKNKVYKLKKHMKRDFPDIVGKKVILYAPTFRGDVLQRIFYEKIDLKYIKQRLGDDYVLIYKLHPLLGDMNLLGEFNIMGGIINGNKQNIFKIFSVTDYLITDYSSILFDFTILNKPIISFVPDIERYERDVGMYIEYEKVIPALICKTENEIVSAIKSDSFDLDRIKRFRNKYFKYSDGNSTYRIVSFIRDLVEDKS